MSYTLQEVPTRVLLAALRDFPHEDPYDDAAPEVVYVHKRPANVPGGFDVIHATHDAIRTELRTRPHVPGKKEAQILRRLMAQTGWTEEQLRAHPRFGMELADAQFPNRRVLEPGPYADRLRQSLGDHWFGRQYKVVP